MNGHVKTIILESDIIRDVGHCLLFWSMHLRSYGYIKVKQSNMLTIQVV